MTYPGLVLLVGVGIGLATFLYYMFAENESENDQRQQYNCADERTSDHYNDWRNSPALSHRFERYQCLKCMCKNIHISILVKGYR